MQCRSSKNEIMCTRMGSVLLWSECEVPLGINTKYEIPTLSGLRERSISWKFSYFVVYAPYDSKRVSVLLLVLGDQEELDDEIWRGLQHCHSVQNMSWKSSTKSTLSYLNSFSCVHIRLSQLVFYLSLFKCIFEALRGISGGSFQAEGMCRSSRTNQIWALQRRELPGTHSILSLEIHL